RDLSANAFYIPFGGFEDRSGTFPGNIGGFDFRLIPKMFFGPGGLPQFGVNTPLPHSAPNAATSPFYKNPFVIAPTQYPGPPNNERGGGDYFFYNFAAFTPALPPADRQSFYGSFTRDLCDKYLVLFADFKYTRSFFDASLAAVPFTPDPFKTPDTNTFFSPNGISVPIQNAFNPFTVGDAT